jgi:hypothetical protein
MIRGQRGKYTLITAVRLHSKCTIGHGENINIDAFTLCTYIHSICCFSIICDEPYEKIQRKPYVTTHGKLSFLSTDDGTLIKATVLRV